MPRIRALVAILILLGPACAGAQHITEECARTFQKLEDELYYGAKCETDADCQEIHFGCPFGCGTGLNKDFDVITFNLKKKLFENECGGCRYQCVEEPKELMCATGRCRLIYHSEIEAWRAEERRKAEKERREFIEEKYGLSPRWE